MDRKLISAVIIGVVLFSIGVALQVFAGQEGLRIILSFIIPFIVGVVAVGIKRGFVLGFVLSFVFAIVGLFIVSPESVRAMQDLNVAAAVLIMFLLFSVIAGVLGAVGGLIGGRVFRK